jgi:hypothetical protein
MKINEFNILTQQNVSLMLLDVADGVFKPVKNRIQRETCLRTTICAWNIACLSKHDYEDGIKNLIEQYKIVNPSSDFHKILNYAKNVRQLINRKKSIYPGVKLKILDFSIDLIDGIEHVSVVIPPDN